MYVVNRMEWTNRDGRKCIYNGEVDENGLVCGEGVAYDRSNNHKFEFTCLDGEEHGICKLLSFIETALFI